MPPLQFLSREHFGPGAGGHQTYQLLPFKFMRWRDGRVFLSNIAGEYILLSSDDFADLVSGKLSVRSKTYRWLKSKQMLMDGSAALPVALLATKLATKYDWLSGFTRLHLFVLTLRCEHTCAYCQVSRVTQDRVRFDMSKEVAAKSIEVMFSSPAAALKVEFQGGEPLLNFPLLRWIVEAVSERAMREGRSVEFVVATNLALVDDEMLAFMAAHRILVSTSLDGPEWLHNSNRPRPGGDSFQRAVAGIAKARAALGTDRVSAVMTTTTDSLQHPVAIVDEYVRLGFESIFLRAISPYGFATRSKTSRYEVDRFLEFYGTGLQHVIELNRAGTPMVEVFAQILLQKIVTPFATGYVDMQSPAGAGIGAVVYNYDGDVYVSDEGRMLAQMGDPSFRLGNVLTDDYQTIFGGPLLRSLVAASCHETMPGCSDCAFSPFCGSDPVLNWATQGDPLGHRPTSGFCSKSMGVLSYLIELLEGDDEFVRELLLSWATGVDPVPTQVVRAND